MVIHAGKDTHKGKGSKLRSGIGKGKGSKAATFHLGSGKGGTAKGAAHHEEIDPSSDGTESEPDLGGRSEFGAMYLLHLISRG